MLSKSNQSCCNNDCNQGRDCPERKSYMSIWLIIPPALFVIMMGGMVFIGLQQDRNVVRYNCSLSEISPDFPVAVKEECRKQRKL